MNIRKIQLSHTFSHDEKGTRKEILEGYRGIYLSNPGRGSSLDKGGENINICNQKKIEVSPKLRRAGTE